MLPGVDLHLEPLLLDRCDFGRESVVEGDPALPLLPLRLAEPGIQRAVNGIHDRADPPSLHLHEIDVLRVSRRCPQKELLQRGAATKGNLASKDFLGVEINERPREDEVLLDLLVERPRRLGTPLGDVGPLDHRSASTCSLTTTRQRRSMGHPLRG